MCPHEKSTKMLMNGPFLVGSPGMHIVCCNPSHRWVCADIRGEANRKPFRVCGIVKEGELLGQSALDSG